MDYWTWWEVPSCGHGECRGRAVHPVVAAIMGGVAAWVVLLKPFFASLGVSLTPGFSQPISSLYEPISYSLGFIIAVFLTATRRHENPLWCLVDSISIPVLVAFIVGLHGVAHP